MRYDSVATSIDKNANDAEGTISKLKSISFDSIWSGGSYQSLTTAINTKIDEVETGIKNIKQYAQALFKLQEYKNNLIGEIQNKEYEQLTNYPILSNLLKSLTWIAVSGMASMRGCYHATITA